MFIFCINILPVVASYLWKKFYSRKIQFHWASSRFQWSNFSFKLAPSSGLQSEQYKYSWFTVSFADKVIAMAAISATSGLALNMNADFFQS